MPAPVIPDATFPIPPPVAHLPIVQPGNGTFTPVGLELFTKIWAAIQGGGGVYPSIQVLQQEVATIFAMHGDGTLSSDGVLTVTKTQGVPFGYFATGTDASHLTGTVPVAALPIATIATVGVVKPDGTTITIDPDGTIHSAGGAGVSITGTDGNLVFTPDPITGAGDIDFAPNINVTGYLNVGSVGPSPDPVAGHIVGIQLHDTGAFTSNVFFGQPVFGSSFGYAPTAFPAGTSYGFGIGSIAPADAGGTTGTVGSIFSAQITGSANAVALTSNINLAVHAGTGTIGAGGVIAQRASARMTGAGNITGGMIGLQADVRNSGGTAVSGFAAAIQVPSPTVSGGGSAFGTVYGVEIFAQKVTGVTKGYGVNQVGTADLNVFAGKTFIGAATDPTHELDVGGNETVSGYLGVGSNTSPTNTTAGDLTALRFFLNDLASGGTQSMTLYDPSAITGAAVIHNWQTVGGANTNQNLIHLNYGLQLTGANSALHGIGVQGAVLWDSTGTLGDATGGFFNTRSRGASGTALIGDGRAIRTQIQTLNAGSYTSAEGALIDSPSLSGTGTIATLYGVRIKSQKTGTAVTKGYGLYAEGASDLNVFAGATTIGAAADPTASAALDVNSTTGAFMPPRMTTTQRLALTPSNGMAVYDTTLGQNVYYQNGVWLTYATTTPTTLAFLPFAYGSLSSPVAANFALSARVAGSTTSSFGDLTSGRGVEFIVPIDTPVTLLTNIWKWHNAPPAAGTDFSYNAWLMANCGLYSNYIFGIYLKDNAGKFSVWGIRNSQFEQFDYTNISTLTNQTGLNGGATLLNMPVWYRIDRVGTTFNFYISVNGETWQLIRTLSSTAFLGATLTEFGICLAPNNAGGGAGTLVIDCFSFTGP